jgi:hypothetical protein
MIYSLDKGVFCGMLWSNIILKNTLLMCAPTCILPFAFTDKSVVLNMKLRSARSDSQTL